MRTYTDTDTGQTWPLEEADTDYSFRVYKSDRRKATIANPTACILALGLKHDPDVAAAFIGSGKDAFVVFKGKGRRPPLARHYVILAAAARVRDTFDKKGAPRTQWITLSAPTAGRTLDARATLNKRRAAAIKAGAPVRKRATPSKPRITRLGIPSRPRPTVRKGSWTVPELTP